MEENKIKLEEIVEETNEVKHGKSKKDQPITKKDILVSIGIVLGVAVLVCAIILASVFGIAHTKAKEQVNVELMDGVEWSKNYLCAWLNSRNNATNNNLNLPEGTFEYDLVEFELKKVDKDLKVERPIDNSHYIYNFVFIVRDEKYIVQMDTTNGRILSVEVDD